ncbi:MAG TPA: efflux transporter outer membrane subunit [Steroidobacteraceae bacterium]|nr:efflux transporter outer membrane subunit [Steroidobacteraceae bacterium]
MTRVARFASHVGAVLVVLIAAACTVGPQYRGPPPVATATIQAASFRRATPEAVSGVPTVAEWWEALQDPDLTATIRQALQNSPNIKLAEARVRESRASLREKRLDRAPKSSASAAYIHAGLPNGFASSLSSFDLYSLNFDASWEVDLFGGTRRAIEVAATEAAAVEADLADAQVQLAAETAHAYFDLRDAQQRLELVRASAEIEKRMLSLTEQRRARGVASDLDVERVRTQLEGTQAKMIPLDASIDESLDQLAVLTGQPPGALDATLETLRPLPSLPATVAVADPAALLQQRPDIRAAERRLASGNARIGQRMAGWFPKLTLLGDLGFSSPDPGKVVGSDTLTWLALPTLQWNMPDFGRVRAQVRQADAQYDEAQAQYMGTVLGALRDAETALSRYAHQRQAAVALRNVESSASRSATLTEQRYRAGTCAALDWLDAERTRYAAEQDRVAADAQLLNDYVALQKALGLGWRPVQLARNQGVGPGGRPVQLTRN